MYNSTTAPSEQLSEQAAGPRAPRESNCVTRPTDGLPVPSTHDKSRQTGQDLYHASLTLASKLQYHSSKHNPTQTNDHTLTQFDFCDCDFKSMVNYLAKLIAIAGFAGCGLGLAFVVFHGRSESKRLSAASSVAPQVIELNLGDNMVGAPTRGRLLLRIQPISLSVYSRSNLAVGV